MQDPYGATHVHVVNILSACIISEKSARATHTHRQTNTPYYAMTSV